MQIAFGRVLHWLSKIANNASHHRGLSTSPTVLPFWVPVLGNLKTTWSLARDLQDRTVQCWCGWIVRCHWSHILLHQHLTCASVWPDCELAFAVCLLILAKQHCDRLAGVLGGEGGGLNFSTFSCKSTTDVSICEAETGSAILAEPLKSQDLLS